MVCRGQSAVYFNLLKYAVLNLMKIKYDGTVDIGLTQGRDLISNKAQDVIKYFV
jgi:hypothetical protein